MDSNTLISLGLSFVVLFALIKNTFVIQENQRLVILRMGKLKKIAGPGLSFIVPFIDLGFVVELSKVLPGWLEMTEEERLKKITDLVKLNPDPSIYK